MPMKFSKLVETVSKKPIAPHVKQLVAEVMATDEEGELTAGRRFTPVAFSV